MKINDLVKVKEYVYPNCYGIIVAIDELGYWCLIKKTKELAIKTWEEIPNEDKKFIKNNPRIANSVGKYDGFFSVQLKSNLIEVKL